MPTISRIPVETLLSQFSKRDGEERNGDGNEDSQSPVPIAGLVVAILTLLVGIGSLRSSRFRHLVWSLSPLSLIKKILGSTLLDHMPTVMIAREDSSVIPVAEISIHSPVFIYNYYSNAPIIGTNSGTFSNGHGGITGEAVRMSQAAERPGPTVAGRFQRR